MRKREDIVAELPNPTNASKDQLIYGLQLEVLLDIRDLLDKRKV